MRFSSYLTRSYWKYALFSRQAGADFLAALGAFYLTLELLDFFKIVARETAPRNFFFVLLAAAVGWVLLS